MILERLQYERLEKLKKVQIFLNDVETKLKSFSEAINWNYKNLSKMISPEMVSCSYNQHHMVPKTKIDTHEVNCQLKSETKSNFEMPFQNNFSQGSFVTFDSEMLYKITANLQTPFTGDKSKRSVPSSGAEFDCDFSREEKLAIYEYVIANTKKQDLFSDLYMMPCEKKEEKKELSAWEIAAAERDAKRRRASYRNKVHINHKTFTEIMKEVIDAQMESLISQSQSSLKEFSSPDSCKEVKHYSKEKGHNKTFSSESRKNKPKLHSSENSRRRKNNDDEIYRRKRKRHSSDDYGKRSYKWRSPSTLEYSNCSSRPRHDDKHRKRKSYSERSRFSESSKR